jgi:hypothetical protein
MQSSKLILLQRPELSPANPANPLYSLRQLVLLRQSGQMALPYLLYRAWGNSLRLSQR